MLNIPPRFNVKRDGELNKVIYAPCGACRQQTRHETLSSVEVEGRIDTDFELIYGWDDSYQVVQCLGCQSVMFRKTHNNSEEMEHYITPGGDSEVRYVETVDYYPNPERNRVCINDVELLPDSLERIYNETLKSLNNDSPVLVGVGIRAIIETICKDREAKGGNLKQKIDDLVEKKDLSKGGSDILHQLRILGNQSAHEVKPHKNVQLGLAFDVVENLLQSVYILPHHANKRFE